MELVGGEDFNSEALAREMTEKIMPISGQALRDWAEKQTLPKSIRLYQLSKFYQKPMEWFLGEDPPPEPDDSEFTAIPKMTAPISGGDGIWEPSPEIDRYYKFRTEWLKSKGQPNYMKLWEVRGESMSPGIRHGDFVLVDESSKTPSEGMIAALNGPREEFLVKRLKVHADGRISLISDKDESLDGPYEPDQLRIIGKVVWLGREM